MRVPIADIVVGTRARKEMGDIDALAESMARPHGLLQPIVVMPHTSGYLLVAGGRRLAAAGQLGWSEIEVHVITTLADARDLLVAERDENEHHKPFTPSEAVALGKRLERLERPKAQARKASTQAKPGQRVGAVGEDQRSRPRPPGKTRDIVAPAVGMKSATYGRAKSVVEAENDPDPYLREVARKAREEMDETGKVLTAYKKVIDARRNAGAQDRRSIAARERAAEARRLFKAGQTQGEIAKHIGVSESSVQGYLADGDLTRRSGNRAALDRLISQAAGIAVAANDHDGTIVDPEESELDRWEAELTKAIRSLTQLRTRIRKNR